VGGIRAVRGFLFPSSPSLPHTTSVNCITTSVGFFYSQAATEHDRIEQPFSSSRNCILKVLPSTFVFMDVQFWLIFYVLGFRFLEILSIHGDSGMLITQSWRGCNTKLRWTPSFSSLCFLQFCFSVVEQFGVHPVVFLLLFTSKLLALCSASLEDAPVGS
jgi:hypothetical protein